MARRRTYVCQGVRAGGHSSGCGHRSGRNYRGASPRDASLQSERLRRRGATCGVRGHRVLRLVFEPGSRIEAAALRSAGEGWCGLLEKRRQFRAGAIRWTRDRRANRTRRQRHSRSRSLERFGMSRLFADHRGRRGAHTKVHHRARVARMRRATIKRVTTETQIALRLTLDGKGRYAVHTGIRFFDHMLELFARHGGFDLNLAASGDLDVDQHHTVEDIGIALGEAVSTALGDRRGINRAGYFLMPMDETLAVAAVDLGGRPHAVVDLKVKVARVGD